jgi:predicted TIM-barrel fold metal-dependent hydrolase
MNVSDLILVSVDDHVVEPPGMFEGRVARRYVDRVPRVVKREDGADVWVYEGAQIETFALNAVVGRPPEEYGVEPQTFGELREGVYDVHSRVKDMSANGELAAINFPTFVGFAGPLFPTFAYRDGDQALAMVRAYNDWHLEEWCWAYPDRFIPMGIMPFWDPELMVAEVTRLAEAGCHAVTFMGDPYPWPALDSEHWDPFWAACQDLETVVCMHLAAGSGNSGLVAAAEADPARPVPPARPAPKMGLGYVGIAASPGSPAAVAAELLNGPIFRKFDRLKIALSEGGIGWIPYFLEQADFRLRHHGAWTGMDFGGRLPSEIFNEHVICCFIEDRAGMAAREFLNMDMVTWECDYPHSDCTWPFAPETAMRCFDGVEEDVVAKVSHLNAMKHFKFDAFARRDPKDCTVGALRAEVAGYDTSIVARGSNGRTSKSDYASLMAASVRR